MLKIDTKQQLQLLLDTIDVGVTVSGPDGKFVIFNQRIQDLTGFGHEEANQNPDFHALTHPGENSLANLTKLPQLKIGQITESETVLRHKDGKETPVLVATRPIELQGQTVYLSTYRDVSGLKQIQAELEQNLDFVNTMVDITPNPVFYCDDQGKVIGCNQAFASQILGMDKEQVVGSLISDYELVKANQDWSGHLADRETRQALSLEIEIKQSDQPKFFHLNQAHYFDQNNQNLGTLGIMSDVTEAKLNKDQLEQRVAQQVTKIEELARVPAENPSPVFRFGKEANLLYANKKAEEVLNLLGCSLDNCRVQQWQGIIARVLENQEGKILEQEIGDQVYSFNFVPVIEHDYVNVYGRDVTQERKAIAMKTEFISMASHQLRTPLTALRWTAKKLLGKYKEGLNQKQLETVETIYKSTVNMNDLVDDLLSISRIETGNIDISPTKVDLCQVAQEAITELEPLAELKNIRLMKNLNHCPEIESDESLLRQIVTNLVSNAIKYTPDGGQVEIIIEPDDQDKNSILLKVSDSGIGIPVEYQDQIFERFFRAPNALHLNKQGTGLGLPMIKMMVERLGGKVRFESEENKGSQFFVRLGRVSNS